MTSFKVSPLADDLPYGAKITGITWTAVKDAGVRKQIKDAFEERGVVVFKNVEPTEEMHFALSEIAGPLQDHPLRATMRDKPAVEPTTKPDLADLTYKGDIIEANGKVLTAWLPWHFDACYTNKLNRAGVLRPIAIPPEGGMTGFADGIQIYNAISPALREQFKDLKIIYHSYLMYMHQRFGMPANHRWLSVSDGVAKLLERCEGARRSIHPAIWKRASGEYVLHVSPWQAAGIYGRLTPEGDELLEELCDEITTKMKPYFHKWEPTDMVMWDNWRLIHCASGNDPKHVRHLQRTTVQGDYGLGDFEPGVEGHAPPSMD